MYNSPWGGTSFVGFELNTTADSWKKVRKMKQEVIFRRQYDTIYGSLIWYMTGSSITGRMMAALELVFSDLN